MSADTASSIFEEIALLLELKGENPFKVKAFQNGARLLMAQQNRFEAFVEEVRAQSVKGFGPQLSAALIELLDTGESAVLAELKASFPKGFLELLEVPGLGPKKLKVLEKELGVADLAALKRACDSHQVAELRGFGEKTEAKFLQGIARIESNRGQMLISEAWELAEQADNFISKVPGVIAYDCFEAIRRGANSFSALEVPLESPLPAAAVAACFEKFPSALKSEVVDEGKRVRLSLDGGLKLDLLLSEGAEKKTSPLLSEKMLKGILHVHSTYSDGVDSLENLARVAKAAGYEYLGITDHSQSAAYARGLKPETVKRQHEEIEKLNQILAPFKILKGIESDILADGSLDYSDKVLESFDFIIASVHSRFSMEGAEMTQRIVRALENPYTDILGHPTGRLLLKRDPYELDIEQILECAAKHSVAIELNCNPRRLDLDWSHHRRAVDLGIKIPICPDAHAIAGFDDLRWGLIMAQKGGLTEKDILNVESLEEIQARFQKKRESI